MNFEAFNTWLESIVQVLNKLYGLPGFALVFVFCLCAGYFLKLLPKVPNVVIPWVVMLSGPVLNLGISEFVNDPTPVRVWIIKQFIIGFIIGGAAWTFHNQILSRIEERFGLFAAKPTATPEPKTP